MGDDKYGMPIRLALVGQRLPAIPMPPDTEPEGQRAHLRLLALERQALAELTTGPAPSFEQQEMARYRAWRDFVQEEASKTPFDRVSRSQRQQAIAERVPGWAAWLGLPVQASRG